MSSTTGLHILQILERIFSVLTGLRSNYQTRSRNNGAEKFYLHLLTKNQFLFTWMPERNLLMTQIWPQWYVYAIVDEMGTNTLMSFSLSITCTEVYRKLISEPTNVHKWSKLLLQIWQYDNYRIIQKILSVTLLYTGM